MFERSRKVKMFRMLRETSVHGANKEYCDLDD